MFRWILGVRRSVCRRRGTSLPMPVKSLSAGCSMFVCSDELSVSDEDDDDDDDAGGFIGETFNVGFGSSTASSS